MRSSSAGNDGLASTGWYGIWSSSFLTRPRCEDEAGGPRGTTSLAAHAGAAAHRSPAAIRPEPDPHDLPRSRAAPAYVYCGCGPSAPGWGRGSGRMFLGTAAPAPTVPARSCHGAPGYSFPSSPIDRCYTPRPARSVAGGERVDLHRMLCTPDGPAAHASAEKPVLLSFADHGGRETDVAGDRRAAHAPGIRARRTRRPADDDRGPGLRGDAVRSEE